MWPKEWLTRRDCLGWPTRRHLDHALIEVDGVPWDVATLVGSLRLHNVSMQLIGLSASARPPAIEGVRALSRAAGPDQVAELVSPGHPYDVPFVLTSGAVERQQSSERATAPGPRLAQPGHDGRRSGGPPEHQRTCRD